MGVPPVRIELLTSLSAVDFAECYDAREMVEWNGVIVNVISLPMLKLNKRVSGRRKDLDDLDHLDQ